MLVRVGDLPIGTIVRDGDSNYHIRPYKVITREEAILDTGFIAPNENAYKFQIVYLLDLEGNETTWSWGDWKVYVVESPTLMGIDGDW